MLNLVWLRRIQKSHSGWHGQTDPNGYEWGGYVYRVILSLQDLMAVVEWGVENDKERKSSLKSEPKVDAEPTRSSTVDSLLTLERDVLLVELHRRYLFAGSGSLFPAAWLAFRLACIDRVSIVRVASQDEYSLNIARLLYFSRLSLAWSAVWPPSALRLGSSSPEAYRRPLPRRPPVSVSSDVAVAAFHDTRFNIGTVTVKLELLHRPHFRFSVHSSLYGFVYSQISVGEGFDQIFFAQSLGPSPRLPSSLLLSELTSLSGALVPCPVPKLWLR